MIFNGVHTRHCHVNITIVFDVLLKNEISCDVNLDLHLYKDPQYIKVNDEKYLPSEQSTPV